MIPGDVKLPLFIKTDENKLNIEILPGGNYDSSDDNFAWYIGFNENIFHQESETIIDAIINKSWIIKDYTDMKNSPADADDINLTLLTPFPDDMDYFINDGIA